MKIIFIFSSYSYKNLLKIIKNKSYLVITHSLKIFIELKNKRINAYLLDIKRNKKYEIEYKENINRYIGLLKELDRKVNKINKNYFSLFFRNKYIFNYIGLQLTLKAIKKKIKKFKNLNFILLGKNWNNNYLDLNLFVDIIETEFQTKIDLKIEKGNFSFLNSFKELKNKIIRYKNKHLFIFSNVFSYLIFNLSFKKKKNKINNIHINKNKDILDYKSVINELFKNFLIQKFNEIKKNIIFDNQNLNKKILKFNNNKNYKWSVPLSDYNDLIFCDYLIKNNIKVTGKMHGGTYGIYKSGVYQKLNYFTDYSLCNSFIVSDILTPVNKKLNLIVKKDLYPKITIDKPNDNLYIFPINLVDSIIGPKLIDSMHYFYNFQKNVIDYFLINRKKKLIIKNYINTSDDFINNALPIYAYLENLNLQNSNILIENKLNFVESIKKYQPHCVIFEYLSTPFYEVYKSEIKIKLLRNKLIKFNRSSNNIIKRRVKFLDKNFQYL